MRARTTLALLAAAAVAACASKFTPRSVIENLRVLAIVASPLELYPGQTSVSLSARTVLGSGLPPASGQLQEQWSFCPFSIGPSVGYACASPLPACDYHFPPNTAPQGFDALAQAAACLEALRAAGGLPPTVPPDLAAPEKVELVFRYAVSDGVTRREAVQLVPLTQVAPAVPNTAPVIQEVRICGATFPVSDFGTGSVTPVETGCTLSSGVEVQVEVVLTPGSAQTYTDASGTHVESPVVSFYTTAGRFDYDRGNGPDASVKLKYEEIAGQTEAFLYAVARDLRGGETPIGPYRIQVR